MRMRGVAFVLTLLLTVCGSLVPTPVRAGGLDTAMQDAFGSMVNTTSPSYSKNGQRGVLSGGEFVVKNRIMSMSAFSFEPPHINAGCGGWDLFGGSFSFISAQQIVAMLRSIASNAVAYAFHLALSAISQEIDNKLNEMFGHMNLTNLQNMNSCQIAMKIDNALAGDFKDMLNNMGMNFNADTGAAKDNTDATNQGKAQSPAAQTASQASNGGSPQTVLAVTPGNVIWNALKDANSDSFFAGSDDDTRMQIMTMTGAIITCVPPGNGHGSLPGGTCKNGNPVDGYQQEDAVTYRVDGNLTIDQLIDGWSAGDSVSILTCDENAFCLSPKTVDNTSFKGIKEYILDKLLKGSCGDYYTPGCGLLGRYAHNTNDVTSQDRQIIATIGDPLTVALNKSRLDEFSARLIVEQLVPQIASTLAYKTALSAIGTAKAALSEEQKVDAQTSQMIAQAEVKLANQRLAYDNAHQVNTQLVQYLILINNDANKQRVNALPHMGH